MGKKYRSDALAAVHETAFGLTEAGVMDKRTMKVFDEMCLTPVEELTAKQIRQIRMHEKASQAVFARYLNVTTGLVSQWERGEKHPRGASLKLLTLVAQEGAAVRCVTEHTAVPDDAHIAKLKCSLPPRLRSTFVAFVPGKNRQRPNI